MNQRIQELADKAIEDMPGAWNIPDEFCKKFAELIVRECADIAYKTSWDDLVHGYGQSVIPIHLYDTIKEHFGVEE